MKRYWLRGGIIGALILVIIFVVSLIVCPYDLIPGEPVSALCGAFWIPIAYPWGWYMSAVFFLELEGTFLFVFLGLIFPLAFCALTGALIGWIYGKIKSRNKIAI